MYLHLILYFVISIKSDFFLNEYNIHVIRSNTKQITATQLQ